MSGDCDPDIEVLHEEFEMQFPDLPVGGFYNPTFVGAAGENQWEFRCVYDNYDSDDDSWTWYYDRDRHEFYN